MIRIAKISSLLSVLMLFLLFSFGNQAFAYSGGLLGGKSLNLSSDIDVLNELHPEYTDGNESTFYEIYPNSMNYDTVWYKFTQDYKVGSYRLKANGSMRIRFYDASKTLLHDIGADYSGTQTTYDAGNKVRYVSVENPSGSFMKIYEFDVFGGPAGDITPPADVSGLAETHTETTVTLSWSNPVDSDFSTAKIYRNGVYLGSRSTGGYSDSGLTPGATYVYKVTAIDTSGNESAGKTVTVTLPELPPPPPPPLSSVSASATDTTITLTWNGGEAPYTVTVVGGATLTTNIRSQVISDLVKNTTYTITVKDSKGDSQTITAKTLATSVLKPPSIGSSENIFQKMVNSFGTAGTYAIVIIGGAVALGVLCILAMWAWRLSKRWLGTAK